MLGSGAGFPHAAAGSPGPADPEPGSATMLVCMSFAYACVRISADMDVDADADAAIFRLGADNGSASIQRDARSVSALVVLALVLAAGPKAGISCAATAPRDGPPVAARRILEI